MAVNVYMEGGKHLLGGQKYLLDGYKYLLGRLRILSKRPLDIWGSKQGWNTLSFNSKPVL